MPVPGGRYRRSDDLMIFRCGRCNDERLLPRHWRWHICEVCSGSDNKSVIHRVCKGPHEGEPPAPDLGEDLIR